MDKKQRKPKIIPSCITTAWCTLSNPKVSFCIRDISWNPGIQRQDSFIDRSMLPGALKRINEFI
ncbi:hypothetical protein ACUNFQ_28170, partial [Serratia sp. IR-2025]